MSPYKSELPLYRGLSFSLRQEQEKWHNQIE